MTFWITHPTARKAHRCYDCGGEIPAGDRYRRSEGPQEGEWTTFKSHESCYAAVDAFYQTWGWPDEEGYLALRDLAVDAEPHEQAWLLEHHGPAAERAGLKPASPAAQPPQAQSAPAARGEQREPASEDRPAGRPGGQDR